MVTFSTLPTTNARHCRLEHVRTSLIMLSILYGLVTSVPRIKYGYHLREQMALAMTCSHVLAYTAVQRKSFALIYGAVHVGPSVSPTVCSVC